MHSFRCEKAPGRKSGRERSRLQTRVSGEGLLDYSRYRETSGASDTDVFVSSWPAPLLYTAPLTRSNGGGRWARVRKRRGGRASATLRGPETPRPLTGRYRRSNSDLMRNKVAAGARSAQPRTNSRAFRGISRNRKRPPARLGREISPTPAHRARERRQALRSESKKGVGRRTFGFFRADHIRSIRRA